MDFIEGHVGLLDLIFACAALFTAIDTLGRAFLGLDI